VHLHIAWQHLPDMIRAEVFLRGNSDIFETIQERYNAASVVRDGVNSTTALAVSHAEGSIFEAPMSLLCLPT